MSTQHLRELAEDKTYRVNVPKAELLALLDRLEKLEAVAEASDRAQDNYRTKHDWFDMELDEALAALENK